MLLETELEGKLKTRLEDYGFKVLKLYTPGHTGVMDRMILRPRYSPGPPMFVELKRPKAKGLRPLQLRVAAEWTERGCIILDPVTNMHEMEQLCAKLEQMVHLDRVRRLKDVL